MNKLFFAFLLFACAPVAMLAQSAASKVGINTREPSENLHVNGTVRVQQLPNNGATTSIFTQSDGTGSTTRNQTFNAQKMVVADKHGVLGSFPYVPNWFYMPSVEIPVADMTTEQTINLYQLFTNQFTSPKVRSAGSPTPSPAMPIVKLPAANELYYYVTDYDEDVFDHSKTKIDANGVMTYKVKAAPTPKSYINIVFVLK